MYLFFSSLSFKIGKGDKELGLYKGEKKPQTTPFYSTTELFKMSV